jgi:2-polyprenyl-3-methyl-5-hydroxy-6-metoxy-1,4-benzoquinol methylase
MPSLDWNRALWRTDYSWPKQGDEWSASWGGADMQWHRTILPRIHAFLPADTILEIAPGFGRWTHYLKDQCRRLVVVDLSPRCIDACKQRFAECSHIEYHVNDGLSLDVIADGSIDFVFSFDSLVHAEEDVIRSYLDQLGRKLRPDGIGFLHHSNLGEYARYFAFVERLPGRRRVFEKLKLVERNRHFRAASMTAAKFEGLAGRAGLPCMSQEIVNWGSKRLIDCCSMFTRHGSRWVRPNRVRRNHGFMKEVREAARLAHQYRLESFAPVDDRGQAAVSGRNVGG